MSNRLSVQESLHTFYFVLRRKFQEPENWMILNRSNCLDLYCKNIIYISDRELIKQYFPSADLCYSAWENGLRLKNLVHILYKARRRKCQFCTQTFYLDAIEQYRIHVLSQHIAKGKYGKLTRQISLKYTLQNQRTEILIEQ